MAEEFASALPGLSSAFLFSPDGLAEELSVERPVPRTHGGWLWLHFDLTDSAAVKSIHSVPNLPESAKAMLTAENERQQLHADDSCIYGVFADFVDGMGNGSKDIRFVQFAMTKDLFISGARCNLRALKRLLPMVQRGVKVPGTTALAEIIFEYVIDAADEYTKELVETLDDIEEKILSDETRDLHRMLVEARRAAIRLSRQVAISLSLIHRFDDQSARRSAGTIRLDTGRLGQRLDWLNSAIVAVRERAHVLQDEVMLKTADETNRHLQVLAIVATVFLPATLVAGVFGMNVKGLPLTNNSGGFFGRWLCSLALRPWYIGC